MTSEQFFYSILCSILASFIFLFLVLLLFKPKIKLSPFICKSTYNGNETFYFFKLVNVSVFSAYDVSIELLEVDRYLLPNGHMNDRFRQLTLVLNKVSNIPGYLPSWLRKNAPYAITVRSSENLDLLLSDDYKSVMIKVTLRHGLTGLVKVYSKEFASLSQIKEGKFNYGLKFAPTL